MCAARKSYAYTWKSELRTELTWLWTLSEKQKGFVAWHGIIIIILDQWSVHSAELLSISWKLSSVLWWKIKRVRGPNSQNLNHHDHQNRIAFIATTSLSLHYYHHRDQKFFFWIQVFKNLQKICIVETFLENFYFF